MKRKVKAFTSLHIAPRCSYIVSKTVFSNTDGKSVTSETRLLKAFLSIDTLLVSLRTSSAYSSWFFLPRS